MIWLVAGAIGVIAALWIAHPFLRRGAVEVNDADGTLSVFRDQLDELDRDLAQGLISAEERDAAAQEIERRTLATARRLDAGLSVSRRTPAGALALTCLVAAVALSGYAWQGAPDRPDMPLAKRNTEILMRRAQAGDVNARIALNIERTKANPGSFEDWWRLAVSYASIGDDASSVEAYRRAAELAPDEPGVQAAYAEAMVLANGNKVPQAARIIFETVLRETPDARARYYVALAKAQAQDFEAALVAWVDLLNDSVPEAPYVPLIRRDIVNMVRFLEWELTDVLPDATPAEIATAGGASSDEVNAARIAVLEAELGADPMAWEAWLELAERQAKAGENDKAAEALTVGAAHFAGAPFIQQKFDESARALGMDIRDADEQAVPESGVRGPTGEDVAAITALPQAEQDDMILGMVAGLAAQLEENPDDPDKWVMLVRSYSVLGETEKASAAYARATAHFADRPSILQGLADAAGDIAGTE